MRIELETPEQTKKADTAAAFIPPKDERRTFSSEWKKMREMNLKDAWQYFCDYYRNTLIVIIIAIICLISLITTIIQNKRPYVIEIYLYNNYLSEEADSDAFCEAFAEHMDMNLKDYQMLFSATDYFDPEVSSEEMVTTMYKFAAMISSHELDIIGGNRTFVDNYASGLEDNIYFTDLKTVLSEEVYAKFEEEGRLYYSNILDEEGNIIRSYASAIEVSNTRLTDASQGGLLITPCYIGIPCNTTRLDTALEFINWIFTED